MPDTTAPSELELAALLCSRVCHDVISPVGAITNGLEVLDDETDDEMRGFAMDLIRKSAARASASLQFARLAFGAAGSSGSELDLGELGGIASAFFESDKVRLTWNARVATVEKDRARLLLNLVVIAASAIPRGGSIAVDIQGPSTAPVFTLRAVGDGARVPENARELIAGDRSGPELDARLVQPYFTGLLARRVGIAVDIGISGDEVAIGARPETG